MKCKLCEKPYKDYQGRTRTRCGSCNTKIRRYRAKMSAIRHLGGNCVDCGWSGHQAAFQFHHTNPKEKDFIIGNVANKSWDAIVVELRKCILLCANCHAIRHSTKNEAAFIEEASNYKGRTLPF